MDTRATETTPLLKHTAITVEGSQEEKNSQIVRQCLSTSVKVGLVLTGSVFLMGKAVQYKNTLLDNSDSAFDLRGQYKQANCTALALKDMRIMSKMGSQLNTAAYTMVGYCDRGAEGDALRAQLSTLCSQLLREICDAVWDDRDHLTGEWGMQLLRFALLFISLMTLLSFARQCFRQHQLDSTSGIAMQSLRRDGLVVSSTKKTPQNKIDNRSSPHSKL